MSVTRIASRYAKSLLDLAIEKGTVTRVLEDINALKAAVENRDMYLMLKSPIINTTKKRQIMDALFKDNFDEMSTAFINIVLRKGREMYLPEIVEQFITQYRNYQEISIVKLTSAKELGDNVLAKIKEKLVASSVTHKNVEIQTSIDESLLGGFVIEIGDRLYDTSVAHKLELLRKELMSNSYKSN